MLARELKKNLLGDDADNFHVLAFTDDYSKSWWHVHNDEEVPERWFIKPFPDGRMYI
jgi:hypothetical protein